MANGQSRRRFLARSAAAAAGLVGGFPVPMIAAEEKWGDLVGRLVYDGPAPERKKLTVDKDVECCGKFDIRDESLMVGPDGGLGNVYFYVRNRQVAVCPELEQAAPKRVLLDNKNCIFIPHCMTIWADKQEFHIVNSDPVAQNVAYSPLGDTPANIILAIPPAEGFEATWKFRRSQSLPIPIACNYHPWESAYILPKDHPYAAVTAMDGTFRIAKLPVGKIEIQAWQERIGYLDTPEWPKGRFEIEIKPGVTDLGTRKLNPALFVKK